MTSPAYEVAVLGATPAGLVAAHYLASHGCQVVLVDAPHESTECPLADWVPRTFFHLPGLPKGLSGMAKAQDFSRVCYHNAALTKEVEYRARGAAGHFVLVSALIRSLRTLATRAGVKIRSSTTSPAIRLEEDHVELLGSRQVKASLLLIAQNRPHEVLSELAMPLRSTPATPLLVAGLDVPLPARTAALRHLAGTLHVQELRERTELGTFFLTSGVLHLRVVSNSVASGNRAAELSGMVSSLQHAGILPADLHLGRARGAVWRPPAGLALELETHVAKRCMLVGTAGGFVESIMGQSLAPSIRSALLAADVAMAALKSPEPQNTLMTFKTSWRRSLADYLRPPNTSLHMLLPLLFVNQRIVAKFTRALLYGENI
jgi:2-polyprenyl-6-methoxyphenol hydroxylase-like FAD-dependent oxidoreductase